MLTKCFLIICGIIVTIAIYWPARHARHYDYIESDQILDHLVFYNLNNNEYNLKNCDYNNIIENNYEIEIDDIYKSQLVHWPNKGGVYKPTTCKSKVKVALVIPYRNRKEQLKIFLNYMHNFLQKQNLIYRIFIVEQNDTLPFNRAKMLNYGAKIAINMDYPCLILHDIDLIPITTGNIYACGEKPRHMSSSLDTFRFNLPYLTLVGGAVAIQSEQFQQINGMSNQFYGWGGEDDDFYKRLESNNLLPCRLAPEFSKYTMLLHKKEKASQDRYKHLSDSLNRQSMDGLGSLKGIPIVKNEDLYTLVVPPS